MAVRRLNESFEYSEYDYSHLRQAYDLIEKVYSYNYDSGAESKNLETILRKLNTILEKYEVSFGEVPKYNPLTGTNYPTKNNRNW